MREALTPRIRRVVAAAVVAMALLGGERDVTPEDAVAYLASDAARAVTGQALRVDGGVVTL